MGKVWFVGSMLTVLSASSTPVQSSPVPCVSRARYWSEIGDAGLTASVVARSTYAADHVAFWTTRQNS